MKKIIASISAVSISMFLTTAWAEEGKDSTIADTGKAGTTLEETTATDSAADSVMNQPVDFSSPENVEKSLQNIREKEGEKAYNRVKNALQYILVYDLSLANSEEKLYKKLDGRTPTQIIAKMKR